MKIGIPKEILNNENRVALTPAGVYALKNSGHDVLIEKNAGEGSNFSNEAYQEAGAMIVDTPKEAWSQEFILKVKEPQVEEYDYLYEGQILFTYLHLASHEKLTKVLVEKGVTAIAYETVQLADNSLPLLTPMSEVAGHMAAQLGAQYLEKIKGGKGILLSGISGVKKGKVTVIGGGVVGTNAAKQAIGYGANVTIFDLDSKRLKELTEYFGSSADVLMSNPMDVAEAVENSDLVIGSVLIPGRKAPVLVTEETVKNMENGSVIVDVAIDQGGNFETSDRVTTHDDPTYVKHGVIHYTVSNMPGAVPKTSTIGLTNATMPYILKIANSGLEEALTRNIALQKGVNIYKHQIVNQGVAETFDLTFQELSRLL